MLRINFHLLHANVTVMKIPLPRYLCHLRMVMTTFIRILFWLQSAMQTSTVQAVETNSTAIVLTAGLVVRKLKLAPVLTTILPSLGGLRTTIFFPSVSPQP